MPFGDEDYDESNGNHDGSEIAEMEDVIKSTENRARISLDKLRRADGIITQGGNNNQAGILQKVITAPVKDTDYRQALKMACYLSTHEIDLVCAAIDERQRYGCSLTPIVDWLVARSAGTNYGLIKIALDAYSHARITTDYKSGILDRFNKKGKNESVMP